ncbi:coiled-coil domain-containing protein 66 isoform X3 [Plectropomus leopardus]|uniref:coiled-coil domain-containing protein 66 isoform X3 n=1 Tax=Plectropomus leopardus TaxID=160734 RepID=UPI001C4D7801|nr:coiled-coil domain-containing protein 66 isoform X3 [Plectropomus leopardus]
MNLGDGLLFELENGKPKLILLSHGVEKNPAKQPSFRPRAANILSSRQPSCVEEVQGEERPARQLAGRHKDTKSKAGGAANTTSTAGGRSSTLTTSRAHENHKGGSVKVLAKVKSDKHKHNTTVGSLRANGKTAQPQNSQTPEAGKVRLKDTLARGDAGLKDSVVCLTSEQLQRLLNTVQISSRSQRPPEDLGTRSSGSDGNQTESQSGSSRNGGGGGGGEMKKEDTGGGADITGRSQDKDNRLSGCPFSWLEERQSDSRAAIDAKKAQWRRELDEQVALKQQQQQQHSAPGRLQAEEDAESVFSVQSFVSHRDQPAAIRSSLRLGEVTPMEEVLGVERREEQRRRWLEELDQQREEATERRRREKLLQNQREDHELWAAHFDSLQRRPLVHVAAPSAPPAAPSIGSERGDWEPSSSLSLVWEATSSCGAESVGGVSIDTTSGYRTKASYLRTMTALLDPTQIEERERRRLKQLEQQRAIEAQMEERRQQREQEEARRREEEEEEERRVAVEREMMERQYELDTQRERQKLQSSHQSEQPQRNNNSERNPETLELSVTGQGESLEEKKDVSSSASSYKDTAVQTEAAPSLPPRAETPDVSAQYQQPPAPSAAPPNGRSRAVRTGKENICVQGGGGGDPYEAFARTDRSRKDKRRPEWNTQRPSRRFVPASERYPAALQRNRQESRQRRQAELLALQEKTCLFRSDPPPPPPPQHQEPRLCSNPTQTRTSPTRRVDSVSRGHSVSAAVSSERGCSPPVPAVRNRIQGQQPPPASTSPPPPPVLEFIPYVRTDEVFSLDPLEPADTPPPRTHTEAPPASPPAASHRLLQPELLRNTQTQRQQEILRGLAQLRQGLLQKQRELETDLNPLLKRHDNELQVPSATHRM